MRMLGKAGLMVLAVTLLSACTATHTPAMYLPPRDSIIPGETVTVQGNQNIYAIAQQHHVSMRQIIVLNNLQPPFALKSGQSLVLPAGGSSDVGGGVYSTSSYSGGPTAPTPQSAAQPVVESSSLPPIQTAPLQSESLPPVQANPANSAPTTTYTNAPKSIGAVQQPSAVEALNTPTVAPKPVATTVTSSIKSEPASASAPVSVAPTPAPAPAATTPAADSGPGSAINMVWPVQGPVLSGFGPKGQGLNNDGVNIGAPKGAPVVAAANGIVVYAGNEMKGFGNLVLIRHSGGWVTAYAHLDRMLVSKDAVVAQGDMIGTVGKTGNVPSPQLHFETRFKDKPVDPNGVIKSN